ncbi:MULTISPECIES: hypothetical protein [unclassified Streptomyces]|uniref:hypothetical protein n=1 Tax=unclassified Streptomyces TaxID=2593676 RepID=UPI0033F2FC06
MTVEWGRMPSAGFGPCKCPDPTCKLKRPPNVQHEREEADSPTLTALRERIREDFESRRRLGTLGRLL